MDKLKKWAFDKLIANVEKIKDNGLRLGQNYFNELLKFEPRMANKIRGTEFDPFHNDSIIEKFLDHIKIGFYVINSEFDGYKIWNFEKEELFYTSDREQVKRVIEKLRETGEITDDPITDFKPKLLVIGEKHWDNYSLIRTESDLNDSAFKYFKQNVNLYEEWNMPKELDYDQDFIDNAPESMKEKLQKDLDYNIKKKKIYKEHNNLVRFLKEKLEKNNKTGCYSLLGDFDVEYELTNFNNL